jgi:hypothetical protein
MAKQYYFVVYYDTETKEWCSDPEREDAVFHNDRVWDTASEEWERGEFGEGTEADAIASELDTILNKASA